MVTQLGGVEDIWSSIPHQYPVSVKVKPFSEGRGGAVLRLVRAETLGYVHRRYRDANEMT
jgi:hypothetical protein